MPLYNAARQIATSEVFSWNCYGVVYHQYRWPFLAVMALTMASAGLGYRYHCFLSINT
ncbi:hypothetical protein M8494_00365 [Serratia ureilytica]